MRLPIYVIDAFTSRVLSGNPAAVCPLEARQPWPDDALLQAIAAENRLSETAFLRREGAAFRLRWFTPVAEVDLCGHATLAAAFVVLHYLEPGADAARFDTRSGRLTVVREGERLTMDFPAWEPQPAPAPEALREGLGREPTAVLRGPDALPDWVAVFETEGEVRALAPDMARLGEVEGRGVIATAPGTDGDFVSRFFAPRLGVPEDPVTGSAHSLLAPYWARRLGRDRLHARQVSARGGELFCALRGDRLALSGHAVRYLEGHLWV